MKILRTAILVTSLAAMSIGTALAMPTVGQGGGYYGGAEFVGPTGMTVGPYPTYMQCDNALQAGLYNHTHNHGEQLESLTPCHYRPPYSVAHDHYYELQVVARDPGESGRVGTLLLDQVKRLREAYHMDDYERDLGEFVEITNRK